MPTFKRWSGVDDGDDGDDVDVNDNDDNDDTGVKMCEKLGPIWLQF